MAFLGKHRCPFAPMLPKWGYRKEPRKISTIFGDLKLPIRAVACCRCGARYSPVSASTKDPFCRRIPYDDIAIGINDKEGQRWRLDQGPRSSVGFHQVLLGPFGLFHLSLQFPVCWCFSRRLIIGLLIRRNNTAPARRTEIAEPSAIRPAVTKGARISARSIFATIVSAVHPCISRAFSIVVAPAFDRFHGDGPPGSRQVWLCW